MTSDPASVLIKEEDVALDDEFDEAIEDLSQEQDHVKQLLSSEHLPTSIITPSPFPQHNDSSRFRTAYQRITANRYDTEAWQAVVTEASQCAFNVVLSPPQLSWVASCYGALLDSFPFAVTHITGIVEILMQQRATATAAAVALTPSYCEKQLNTLFTKYLGVNRTTTKNEETTEEEEEPTLVLCSWVVDLWLLYIRKIKEDEGDVLAAFEKAVACAGDAHNNHLLWKEYVEFTATHSIELRRAVFQQLIVHPMTGLDQYWHQYQQFESQHTVGAPLIAEYQPKYQNARSVYLEHAKVMQGHDLHYGMMDAGTAEDDDDDSALTAWLWKTAYERTRKTPLSSCRQWYCQMVCTLARHPEAWYMWATFDSGNAPAIFDVAATVLPDSTLMAYCRASAEPTDAVRILSEHVATAPTSLGFILLQKVVRRNQSMTAARRVFAEARRVLEATKGTTADGAEQTNAEEPGAEKEKDTETTNTLQDTQSVARVKHRKVNGHATPSVADATGPQETAKSVIPPGPVTWHLYAAHATIEQYQNQSPDIAARVYELGLRTHKQWITVPAYVRRYATLLTDHTAVRALWKRAVAAATEPGVRAALYEGWLETESLLGGDAIQLAGTLQAERHTAMYGETQDVVTGNWLSGPVGPLVMGAQKITVSEFLTRERGLEASSKIVNGLGHVMDTLNIMGVWGEGRSETSTKEALDEAQYYPGGASDIAMHKRLRRRHRPESAATSAPLLGLNKPSVRDRLVTGQQQQGGTAIMMAIQQSPEWLRELLYLLPASRTQRAMVAKPPPHLTNLALATLRQNSLPAERPIERKRSRVDSSDEEGGDAASSGYGIAFRKRQRVRMAESGIGQLN